jgi:uncharacterized DUF497 family protein
MVGGHDGGGDVGPADTSALRFERHAAKSALNRVKHGVDFEEATAMWRDRPRLEIDVDHPVEPRLLTIAPLNGRIWTAVTTIRGDAIRLISVRRSRKEEVTLYERRLKEG